jgi:hypothetical protein
MDQSGNKEQLSTIPKFWGKSGQQETAISVQIEK